MLRSITQRAARGSPRHHINSNPLLNTIRRQLLHRLRRGIEADPLLWPALPRRAAKPFPQSIFEPRPPSTARRPMRPVSTVKPSAPCRRPSSSCCPHQHRLRLLRHLQHHQHHDRGQAPAKATEALVSQVCWRQLAQHVFSSSAAQSVILMGIAVAYDRVPVLASVRNAGPLLIYGRASRDSDTLLPHLAPSWAGDRDRRRSGLISPSSPATAGQRG